MPTGLRSKKSKSVNVVMTLDARRALDEMAASRSTDDKQVYASDLVREAVAEYLAARGVVIEITVDRGGYRERED